MNKFNTTKFCDVEIKGIPCHKDTVPKNEAMENGILPKHPASMIISGSTGSGKSNLLCKLFIEKNLYGGYFHEIIFISPTCKTDDIVKNLKLDEDHCIDNITPDMLAQILEQQRKLIKKHGEKKIGKEHRIAVIFDDIVGNTKLLNSKPFKDIFIANRHYHITVILLTQSWRLIPRSIRLQANSCFFFPMSKSESNRLCEDLCPNGFTKKEFENLIDEATKEKYSFLHINKTEPMEKRYRRNMNEIFNV